MADSQRTPFYATETVTLHHGDCLKVLRDLPDSSVDSVVTDPPYGLGFMGKAWDDLPPGLPFAQECLRVLKPGGHLLAFGGSRTWHRLAVAVEDAGFEIRDSIAWLYGSGFPKSLDVSKAIDKRGGNAHLAGEIAAAIKSAREARGWTTGQADRHFCGGSTNWTWYEGRGGMCRPPTPIDFARIVAEWPELTPWAESVAEASREVVGQRTTGIGTGGGSTPIMRDGTRDITASSSDTAKTWDGWGTALKPAFEPIVVGRKPLAGTVAANVLAHGTGALNIAASRVGSDDNLVRPAIARDDNEVFGKGLGLGVQENPAGRWPTNVILDESQADELDAHTGVTRSRVGKPRGANAGDGWGMTQTGAEYEDQGGASRFFPTFRYEAKAPTDERPNVDGVAHPTVKPLDLMRWLVRLVTPPGGTVLEPFAGSGTTVEACILERFNVIAIERDETYLPLIRQRIDRRIDPVAFLESKGEDIGLLGLLAGGAA